VTGTDAGGCSGTATAIVSEIIPTPVDLGNDITVCSDDTIIVVDAGNTFGAYSWNTAQTSQSISVQTSGTYSVTVADANGCTATDAVNIIISRNPTVEIQAERAVYEGTDVTLAANITPAPDGSVIYYWQTPASL